MRPSIVALLCCVVVAAGCSVLTAREDPTRFYVLSPTADAPTDAPTHLVLGLGPITLPRYLQNSALVRRAGPNEVQFADFDRWAGPLDGQIARTLAEELHVLLGSDRIVTFPWYQDAMLDAAVVIEVFQFEPDTDGQAHLVARWKLMTRDGAMVRAADVDLHEPVNGRSTDATVGALSRVLGRLAQEIAGGVRATAAAIDRQPHRRRNAE